MKKNRKFIMAIVLVFTLLLVGCTPSQPSQIQLSEKEEIIDGLNERIQELERQIQENEESSPLSSGPEPGDSLMDLALDVIELIKDKNFSDLVAYIHPNKGVRFSPYAYIDIQDDQVFQPAQFQNLSGNPNIYLWGAYDGSGDPINITFDDYYDRFIYDEDFANPHMYGNNYAIGMGNTIDNFSQAYPNGQFIEFHFTGFDPQFDGIDWRSLRLAFEQHNNTWHLVGIIHSEWTI